MIDLLSIIPGEWLWGALAAVIGAVGLWVRGWMNRRHGAEQERQRAREADRERADGTRKDLADLLRDNDGRVLDRDDPRGYRD